MTRSRPQGRCQRTCPCIKRGNGNAPSHRHFRLLLAFLRYFRIARAPAVVTSVLFAFAPYHFYRSENHLHFSAYYVIPLGGMVLFWIMLDERLFVPVRRCESGEPN